MTTLGFPASVSSFRKSKSSAPKYLASCSAADGRVIYEKVTAALDAAWGAGLSVVGAVPGS